MVATRRAAQAESGEQAQGTIEAPAQGLDVGFSSISLARSRLHGASLPHP
jgi:hypothetical protein